METYSAAFILGIKVAVEENIRLILGKTASNSCLESNIGGIVENSKRIEDK
jgi:hypothetical protein